MKKQIDPAVSQKIASLWMVSTFSALNQQDLLLEKLLDAKRLTKEDKAHVQVFKTKIIELMNEIETEFELGI